MPSLEGERTVGGDGDPNGGDGDSGDGDGTASGNGVDSSRVKAVRLAGESQHMRWSRRKQTKYSPVSSGPPTKRSERLYGPVKRQRRCGRIKVEPRNISQTRKVEKTYRIRASTAQPPGHDSRRAFGVIGPRRRCGRLKIESVKVKIERVSDKTAQEVELTHLERTCAAQPPANDSKRLNKVIGPRP